MTNGFTNTPPPSARQVPPPLKLRRDEPTPLPPSARQASGE